jgi:hypothetical protein
MPMLWIGPMSTRQSGRSTVVGMYEVRTLDFPVCTSARPGYVPREPDSVLGEHISWESASSNVNLIYVAISS